MRCGRCDDFDPGPCNHCDRPNREVRPQRMKPPPPKTESFQTGWNMPVWCAWVIGVVVIMDVVLYALLTFTRQ